MRDWILAELKAKMGGTVMIKSESEIWRAHPEYTGIEVSTFGRVRTLDRVVSTDKYTQFVKGRVLKQYKPRSGYLQVSVKVDGKWKMENVHRLVAQTYIPNPDNLPEVNHKSCVRTDNHVKNLEWCTRKQNIAYREKYGTPAKDYVQKSPVYAVNLKTQEILWFESQMEAGRVLGVSQGNIYSVIKGNRKQTHGFWFTNADDNAADAIKNKLEKV